MPAKVVKEAIEPFLAYRPCLFFVGDFCQPILGGGVLFFQLGGTAMVFVLVLSDAGVPFNALLYELIVLTLEINEGKNLEINERSSSLTAWFFDAP